MKKVSISFTLNGDDVSAEVPITWTLLQSLREVFELTGAKEGCGVGECGACTVIVDGQTVNACIYPVAEIDGRQVTTIEGLADKEGNLDPLQTAFLENNGVQCGFCTPGFIMSSTAFVEKHQGQNVTRQDIRREHAGNLCRCGAYDHYLNAVERAANNMREAGQLT